MRGWSPVLATNGGNTMVRKVIIALAAVTFAGAMAAPTPADAGMGGGFRGGGFHGAAIGGGFRGGGFHGAAIGGGFRGGMVGGGFRGAAFRGGVVGGGFRGAAFRGGVVGGGFRSAAFRGGVAGGGFRSAAFRGGVVGGGFRSAAFRGGVVGGGFRSAAFRGGFVGSRSFAFRPGFAPRVNRFAFARFNRFHHRRFAFAAVPFVAGVGLYGGSCWGLAPTPWGWQRVWACDYDYGYY